MFTTHNKSYLSLLLAVILMAVQGLVLIHETDFEAHATGEVCDYCLHAKLLGHALAADVADVVSPLFHSTYLQPPIQNAIIATDHSPFQARGPPPFLFA